MDKKQIRKVLLQKRNDINNNIKEKYDLIIFNKLKIKLSKYNNIASYYSINSEVDTKRINKWILDNKNLYLPKIVNDKIKFYKVDNLNELQLGKYNIYEPTSLVEETKLDCILIPMLGYNLNNYRIGYGKGFYDKYLCDFNGYKLGIAYSMQYCGDLIIEKHDEKLDFILTEL